VVPIARLRSMSIVGGWKEGHWRSWTGGDKLATVCAATRPHSTTQAAPRVDGCLRGNANPLNIKEMLTRARVCGETVAEEEQEEQEEQEAQ
jgi:hypothetical protein